MIVLVIGIAVWIANLLTGRITRMIDGIHAFQDGDLTRRLETNSSDEMGELAAPSTTWLTRSQESFKRLEEARGEAEEASRQKSAFLATVSHELRTPLNGILGFAELLKSELTEPDPAGVRRNHPAKRRTSAQSGHRDSRSDQDRIGRDDFQALDSDIPIKAELVEETAAIHRGRQRSKGFDALNCTWQPTCRHSDHTDPTRLRQILNNLLNNAVKFTEQGEVSGWTVSQSDGEMAFAVRDTGRHPAGSRETIFEKFKQLENFLTREHGGTGLGLAGQATDRTYGRPHQLESEVGRRLHL
jgi:signal transduction histidine kinase